MKFKVALVVVIFVVSGTGAFADDLFEEAGHDLGKSRWVLIRFIPSIQIALESDDVVLIMSVDHPAKSFAMKIDGKAVAGDCAVTESKDAEYTVASSDSKSKLTTGTTTTTTTYWASCEFEKGTSERALRAGEIVVQVAMTNGTTNPHQLKPKQLRKFQALK